MTIILNGSPHDLPRDACVADAVAALGEDAPSRLAVAVNGEVVRRAEWETTALTEGDRVEIVAAIQGGHA